MIIYLHGLNSSPLSSKGVMLAEYCATHKINCAVPQLPHYPAQAVALINEMLPQEGKHTLVGSSMGGYYAAWFCERRDNVRAVLVNPAVRLADKLESFVGQEQQMYHSSETYLFTQKHLDELRALEIPRITHPQKYLLLAQTGDEVLDYQEAADYFVGGRQIIEEGGDHSFIGFARHLPLIADWAKQK